MFKELGEFIDNVGKDSASIIRQAFKREKFITDGVIDDRPDEDDIGIDLSELGEDMIISVRIEEDEGTKT